MIVCDKCKEFGKPAFALHLSIGIYQDPVKPGYFPLVTISRREPGKETHLCEPCAKIVSRQMYDVLQNSLKGPPQ